MDLADINPNTSLRGVVVSLPSVKPDPTWTPADEAWADQAMTEQAEQFRRDAEDAEQMRKALAGTAQCENCSGTGFDAEPDGYGGAIGGPCAECNSTGRVKSAKPIPAGLKALPDPLAMLETLRESERRWAANDYMNYDRPDATALIDEIERLQVAEGDLGEILAATTALLLVLSQPKVKAVIASLGTHGPEAVERFCNAEKEARNG